MKGFVKILAAGVAISLIGFSAFAEDFSSDISENVSTSNVSDEENFSQLNFSYEITEMENGGLSLSIDATDPERSIDSKPWIDKAEQIKEIFIKGCNNSK